MQQLVLEEDGVELGSGELGRDGVRGEVVPREVARPVPEDAPVERAPEAHARAEHMRPVQYR